MARLFTRAALAVALLSAVPADAFFPGGAMVARRPALRHLSGVCPRRAAPAAARMSSAGDDRPGAAEQEAAIKAAKEAARMKTKSGGASSAGIKRLGTVRVPGQSVMRAMQPAGPNGRRIGTVRVPGTMAPLNNIVSAATLRYEEAAKKLAAEASAIIQESLQYGPQILALSSKIDALKPKIEPYAWAPDWVPVSEELELARRENSAAQAKLEELVEKRRALAIQLDEIREATDTAIKHAKESGVVLTGL